MRRLTHNEFIERLGLKNKHFIDGSLEIVGRYSNKRTPIQCRCSVHNYIWDEFPERLYEGLSCPQCDTKKVSEFKLFGDRPSLWISRPDVAKLLKNPDDGYKCTYGTIKKFEFICPDCGNVVLKPVSQVSHNGLCCKKCSDGVSFPNKYSRALLDQLPVDDYECEYHPDWAKPYFYDNYFEYMDEKYVLEMDGAYHYLEKSPSKKSLAERCEDDKTKDVLAKQNGVNIIRINCLTPQADYIKEQILTSDLASIFDLSIIDWELCDKNAQKNILKRACEIYMKHEFTLTEIRRILHIGRDTLIRYLKTGRRLGWCDYDPDKNKAYPQPIIVLDENRNIIHNFYSIRETERSMEKIYDIKIDRYCLVQACKKDSLYKGFYFRLDDKNNTHLLCDERSG